MQVMQENKEKTTELALEKAAKMICDLKSGICPVREENFAGCPDSCHEEIIPWRCWVLHLKDIAQAER